MVFSLNHTIFGCYTTLRSYDNVKMPLPGIFQFNITKNMDNLSMVLRHYSHSCTQDLLFSFYLSTCFLKSIQILKASRHVYTIKRFKTLNMPKERQNIIKTQKELSW